VVVVTISPLLALLVLLGGLLGVVWRHQSTARDAALLCPRCRRALQSRAGEVVASRHCPFCGGRVLTAGPAPGRLAGGRRAIALGAAQFQAAAARYRRRMQVGVCSVASASLALYATLTYGLPDWRDVPGAEGAPLGLQMLVASSPVWLMVVGVTLLSLRYQLSARDPVLLCPGCRLALQLHVPVVVAWRCCPKCGGRVLAG
jgi:Zn-finger nucleic acid-binding protein